MLRIQEIMYNDYSCLISHDTTLDLIRHMPTQFKSISRVKYYRHCMLRLFFKVFINSKLFENKYFFTDFP